MRHPRLTHRTRLGILVSAAWIGPAILAMLNAYLQGRLGNWHVNWRDLLWEGGDWLLYGALTPLVFELSRRFPFRRDRLVQQLLVHLACALALCLVWAALGTILRHLILRGPAGAITLRFITSWSLTTLPFGVAVYFAVVGIEHASFYFAQAREREMQAARLASQLAEARLAALRMQLNPHFLFNSLNAIAVLVRDQDTATASRMLEQLGDVLREVLRNDREHEVPLDSEIAFLRRYLSIEQVRFSDRLRPTFDVDPSVTDALVPSFILQPLVENALRHGIAQRTSAGALHVAARREHDDLVLVVRDDGPGLSNDASAEGVGLSNVRERLKTLYGRATLELQTGEFGGTVATIRLPFHTLPHVEDAAVD